MLSTDVSTLTIVLISIISMAVAMLWYSPVMFGKQWMKLSGFTKKDMEKAKKKGMTKTYLYAFIATLVFTWVTAGLISALGIDSARAGMQLGFWIWLGFLATTMFNEILWKNGNVQLYFINVLYQLVNLLIIGALIVMWG